MFLTLEWALGSNVTDSLDGAYLGLSVQKLQGLNNNVTMLIILTNSQFLQYKALHSGQRCQIHPITEHVVKLHTFKVLQV